MTYPNIVDLSSTGGCYEKYIDKIYDIYINEVVNGYPKLNFLGSELRHTFNPKSFGKGFGFWHCVSEEGETDAEDDRIIDLERCKRISWVRYAILNIQEDGQGEVIWWRVKRGQKQRIVLFITSENYAVVLEDRNQYVLLWTTYLVKSNRARKFYKEHREYWESMP